MYPQDAIEAASARGNVDEYIRSTVGDMLQYFKNAARNVRDGVVTTGVDLAKRALSRSIANDFLHYAVEVFTRAADATVVDAILRAVDRSVKAMVHSLGGVVLIWMGIFTNGTNPDSLRFILDHLSDLMVFLYDLVRPINVVPRFPAALADATEGESDEFPGKDNVYNEIDLGRSENLNAIVYQIQRVALTVVAIVRMGSERKLRGGLSDLNMNVSLPSDVDANDNPPPPTYVSKLEGDGPGKPKEKWLFINGIANEYVWFQRSCDKIRDTFKREVKGVYNRSDGILWDFIECCGEHSAASSESNNKLIQRTQSSKAAQQALERELNNALWPGGSSDDAKVVMIAHSQGALLLRLALQTLVRRHAKGSWQRRDMEERLRVFTFGNPSIDWRVATDDDDGGGGGGGEEGSDKTGQSLGEFAPTEHYAHKRDFVAMLGVAVPGRSSGYDEDTVFYSKDGRGHLFGAHYVLGAEAYENGEKSKLLKAVNGQDLA